MLQSEWGWTVILDLFLSGFGGCLFAVTAATFLATKGRFQRMIKWAAWTSFGAVALGVCCLLADVGQPLRAMLMPVSFANFSSWMPRGAWGLLAALAVFFLFALAQTGKVRVWLEPKTGEETLRAACMVLAALGIVAGLFVTAYTGFLLKGSVNIPFWNTWLLPASFVCSSAAAGVGAALPFAAFLESEGADVLKKALALAAAVLAALCACVVTGYLFTMQGKAGGGSESAAWVLASPAFALGAACAVVLCAAGIAAFFLVSKESALKASAVVVCVAVVALGLSLRFCVIGAGQHEGLSSPDPLQMADGIVYTLE